MEALQSKFQLQHDASVASLLESLNATLVISTYQAGRLIFISADANGGLKQSPVHFRKPMGVALLDNKMAVATLDEIQVFANAVDLAKKFPYSDEQLDALYLPRATYYCGETDLHDLHFAKGGIWAINTKFSCISSYDINYSFTPRWKPPFIDALTPEDRCHLNGMAVEDHVPVYVTALGKTNVAGGWRENIITGGLLMAVPSGEVILDQLPMPHSPRMIDGSLYLLLSATGEIVKCDPEHKTYEVIYREPAFLRGMIEHQGYLFVGMSKARKSSKTFSKLPVAQEATHAGVIIIDLKTKTKVGELRYESKVDEIFDVQIMPNTCNAALIQTDDPRHRLAVTTKMNSFWKTDNQRKNK